MKFKLFSDFKPNGDQPDAIEALVASLQQKNKHQTLLGVTGSGKTFTIANVIERVQRPTLIISHNKTLAAQLYGEFKAFFPENCVEYFVSYYDYYQPEAYIPQTDIYIEKDASINEEIDRLRLAATSSLLSRRDVVIVASVSAIYGLGSPADYFEMVVHLKVGQELERNTFIRQLIKILYERNDIGFERGKLRVRGDTVDVFPAYASSCIRVEFFGDTVERIAEFDPLTNKLIREFDEYSLYPAKHFILGEGKLDVALENIHRELEARLKELKTQGKLLEAQRLEMRTNYDLEILEELGYCKGVENYSRHLDGREPGSRPYTLFDYFPDDYLLMIDESHVTIPQIRGMFNGDLARKKNLVDHGFRLPSALDNRPMKFDEYESVVNQVIYVSATPGEYELDLSGKPVEQLIRPTGLVDPPVEVRPVEGQVEDLLEEIRKHAERDERILVTTLTKKLAEDLSMFIRDAGLRGEYLHSDIKTLERITIIQDLRAGKFDVLVGVNLLREGLDLPEVSMVAILDADKEGFLRSQTSLIQTIGRCARNVNSKVILYAEKITRSMKNAMDETARRRVKQIAYNEANGITPETIHKAITQGISERLRAHELEYELVGESEDAFYKDEMIFELTEKMLEAAKELHFEEAARLRDRIDEIESLTKNKRPKPRKNRRSK